jgi:hypothetical protein
MCEHPGGSLPTVSVVIACHNAAGTITECLQALQEQCRSAVGEVIVVDSSTDGTDRVVRERFPQVTLVHVTELMTLPQLRARGIAMATGDVVAILDPYSIADRHWSAAFAREHQNRDNAIIGGTVDLYQAERQGAFTWAQYINEYGMFMPPMRAGEIELLAGSNISYKRAALFAGGENPGPEFWKTFVNDNAQAAGQKLWLAPTVMVSLKKPVPFGHFLRTRFDHGRCYAGMRVAQGTSGERWLRAVAAPLLPLVLMWRWGKRYWSKRRYRKKLLYTLPLQLLLFGNWSLGEMIGYMRGSGTSCRKLFY